METTEIIWKSFHFQGCLIGEHGGSVDCVNCGKVSFHSTFWLTLIRTFKSYHLNLNSKFQAHQRKTTESSRSIQHHPCEISLNNSLISIKNSLVFQHVTWNTRDVTLFDYVGRLANRIRALPALFAVLDEVSPFF